MSALRAWIDGALAASALALARDLTGHERPLEALRPARPVALAPERVVAFWSLTAGIGTSTLAALVAHRSASAGRAPVLVDLDRWAPSLALRAGLEAATVADALIRPGAERDVLSRWSNVPFLPGSTAIRGANPDRLGRLLDAVTSGRAAVLDLGAGADALETGVAGRADVLCLCVGTRAAQLQAAFGAMSLLRELAPRVVVAVIGAAEDDARRVASRLPWPLGAAIPADEHLARDDFAARAPTLRAVDRLIGAFA
ncbi:MAG TPA: hypothetical protein VFM93_12870 [Candidatus Limnocylindria bacterium]|nr:hypothetical protein [Candidatus Limnocylindria bacterium]